MNVIVTGGAGFIGSHVVDLLLDRGDQVAVVDNLSSGKRTNLDSRASLFELDVRSPELETAFRQFRPEAVFHLAAQVSVKLSVDAPVEDAEVNVKGTVNLLEQCRAFGVRRLVYISTGGALYGEPESLPCTEEHPVNPLSPYGISKYAAEKYVELYGRLHGLEYTILRFANIYGPRQDPHGEAGVVAIFSRRMLSGQDVIIFGDGRQERDFVYVEDAARACVTALERGSRQAFNIGTGVGTTVNEVFQGLSEFADYQLEATYADLRPGDVYRIYLDASKARRELGWEPRVKLDEGLRRTLDFFRER